MFSRVCSSETPFIQLAGERRATPAGDDNGHEHRSDRQARSRRDILGTNTVFGRCSPRSAFVQPRQNSGAFQGLPEKFEVQVPGRYS